MNPSKALLFLGAVLAVGIPMSYACTEELQGCMKQVQEMAGQAGDVSKMCDTLNKAKKCLEDVEGKCEGAMKDAVKTALKQLETSASVCGGSGGSSGGGSSSGGSKTDCSTSAYQSCIDPKEVCKSYKCVKQLKDKCDGKGFDDLPDMIQKAFKDAAKECGCGALKPSVLVLLATAIIMALRSYF